MRKRLKILIAVVVVIVILLISDAVIVNFTAPIPSSQTVSTIEHSPAFEAQTSNGTYTYLGYDNGRTSPIHCGPISAFSPIQSLIHVFWPPPNYDSATFVFTVQTNSTSNSQSPSPYGILYVRANPNSGQIYGINATPLCL